MSRASRLGFIPPQLPSLTEQPPEGADWIHEVKHDGYRTMLVVERGAARAYTRNGHDWSDRYPGIVAAACKLPCRTAILDGEVIVQDARGISDFEALQAALRSKATLLIFYAFDLLHLDGRDLRELSLVERRAKLQKLLASDPASPLQFSEEFVGDAAAFFRACAAHELEGIVSKLATSRYRSGRSKTWLKTKCFAESELTLVGIDRDRKTGAQRALLAKSERGQLVYAGPAFIMLRGEAREEFEARLARLKQDRPVLSWLRNRDARWVQPTLTLKVKHLANALLLRHATVKGLVRETRERRHGP
jgi:bifunctional non-homologous end joining protein LigD